MRCLEQVVVVPQINRELVRFLWENGDHDRWTDTMMNEFRPRVWRGSVPQCGEASESCGSQRVTGAPAGTIWIGHRIPARSIGRSRAAMCGPAPAAVTARSNPKPSAMRSRLVAGRRHILDGIRIKALQERCYPDPKLLAKGLIRLQDG